MKEDLKIFFSLFKQSGKLFRKHFIELIFIAAIFLIPLFVVNRLFWQNTPFIVHFVANYSVHLFRLFDNTLNISLMILLFLACISVIKLIKILDEKNKYNVLDIYKESFKCLKSYLWIKILYFFKVFVWGLLFIIPGLIFGVLYSLGSMAYLIDGKKGIEALAFSKKLIKPNFVRYTDYILFILLWILIIVYPSISIIDHIMFNLTIWKFYWISNILNDIQVLIASFGGVFFFIFLYYLYLEYKNKLEAVND